MSPLDEEICSLEGEERCGICVDVVIDRGVLDCCQHWFCFTCIDNWAAITNLCPLCQSEFQSITCVPVYDTIGSNNVDDDLFSREEDWNIEGENNTLSFPSYYIDENAVICLDGDDCKIRNGSVSIEEGPDSDTSIACDSCDIWYHAFCVGFDPEGTSEDSWLCPRCTSNELSDVGQLSMPNHHSHIYNASGGCLPTLSGKISISIADAGETAVVVSMVERKEEMQGPHQMQYIERNQTIEEPTKLLSTPLVEEDLKVGVLKASFNANVQKIETPPPESNTIQSLVQQDISSEQIEINELKVLSADIPLKEEPNDLDGSSNPSMRMLAESGSVNVSGSPSTSYDVHADSREEETRTNVAIRASKKKVRVDRNSSSTNLKDSDDGYIALGSRKRKLKKENDGSDIMSIVQGTNGRQRENAAGLRVKKILRRATEDKESSALVQKLKKEIREAVRNKSNLGDNQFNPELLAAFRAAVSGSTTEPAKSSPALVLKAKKVILQKGKVRENLTKKIYGMGGKRKKSWTRDCEIEFWKHRCLQAGKPEKIDTLKSVLNLLKKGPDDEAKIKKGTEGKAATSILSRLYLADSSVFPRKDDIKPLSDFTAKSASNEKGPSTENLSAPSVGNQISKIPQMNKVSTASGSGKCIKIENVSKTDDVKKDKKKWALEILARKTAAAGNNTSEQKQEDDPVLNRNYPLLVQLPIDMRPVLAASRHNKVPISVRQAQLYRLTEHLLRKANLPVIRRTADTELSVADAVNIEKEVADKSNSKLVYVNLMSQEVLHVVENTKPSTPSDPNSSLSVIPTERSEEISDDLSTDPSIEDALKKAGLLSDSPPSSPCQLMKECHLASEFPKETEGEEPGSLLEMGSHPDVDIYGDFEYNLEDEDFIGAASIKISKTQEAEDSKIKMVFSTFNPEKSNSVLDLEEGQEENTKVIANPVTDKRDEVTSLTECEELYGPEKEPLVKNFPENEKLEVSGSSQAVKESNLEIKICVEDVVPQPGVEDGPVCSQTSENVPMEDKLSDTGSKKQPDSSKKQSENSSSTSKKVEAYIKEHIRPLCKSGVITVEQYRWAVRKTTEKVMKFHSKEKNAKFLIKEGDKVKKLAEQYVEASQKRKRN